MRIGIVLSSGPGYSETFFKTKIIGLSKIGTEVILFARGETNPELNCKHIRPYPVFKHPLLRALCVVLILPVVFLRAPRSVVRYWKFEKEDGQRSIEIFRSLYLNAHILTNRVDWLHFGFATIALGRENVAMAIEAKMGVSLRGYDINVYPVDNPGCYTQVWRRVNQVHSISEYLIRQAYTLGLSRDKQFQVITPALEIPEYFKDNFETGDPIHLVTVARLTRIKGLTYGLQAIARLKDQGKKVRYVIVGDGPDEDELKALVESLGLQNEVIFKGVLTHQETLNQIKSSDIYIQPSINEGFCNAVLEAQSLQCLCVASDTGALPENICNNETGWLVKPQDPIALASKIQYVLQLSYEEKERIATSARQRVIKNFKMEQHLSLWKTFYYSINRK